MLLVAIKHSSCGILEWRTGIKAVYEKKPTLTQEQVKHFGGVVKGRFDVWDCNQHLGCWLSLTSRWIVSIKMQVHSYGFISA
jgi:hypothetical protein